MTDLRDLLSRATPRPWHVETQTLDSLDYDTDEPQVYVVHLGTVCTGTVIATMGETTSLTTSQKQANAALIVVAVNALPNLLSELDGARERIAELELDTSALAESLDEISDMLMGRPDMVRALQPLIGWAEKAVMARAAGALQGHIARARALGEKKS